MSERLQDQYQDALNTLGIRDTLAEIEEPKKLKIYLGMIGSEVITLASALLDVSDQVRVILTGENEGYVELKKSLLKGEHLVPTVMRTRADFYIHEAEVPSRSDAIVFHGNASKFKKYSEDKKLTGVLLRMAGVRTPREIEFRYSRMKGWIDEIEQSLGKKSHEVFDYFEVYFPEQHKRDNEELEKFFDTIGRDKRIVIKPRYGKCGEQVRILSYQDFLGYKEREYTPITSDDIQENILVQEKIDSYPVIIEGVRYDWNLRVLVTYDFEKNQYICAGSVVRIDKDGGPVNRSISADFISLETLSALAQWDEKTYQKVKMSVQDIAIKAVTVVSQRGAKRLKQPDQLSKINVQVLSGVDVIVDEQLEPCIIEVNDSNSGCVYELMKLHGLSSIHPIARAIIKKTDIGNALNKTLGVVMRDIKGFIGTLLSSKDFIVEDEAQGGVVIDFVFEKKTDM